jgi:biliverdin reductase
MTRINVGLVGTGYAAQKRAEAFANDERSHLTGICGTMPERARHLADYYGVPPFDDYHALVNDAATDLIVIATMNHLHGAIARAALEAGKHVVVEYPLSLDLGEATHLIEIAKQKKRLLHVEHIELLSGIHHVIVDALPMIGRPFYAQFTSLRAASSVPDKWSYHPVKVGFPLVGALSRIQRLVTVFGPVDTVFCQSRFWRVDGEMDEQPTGEMPYRSCICSAQLRFQDGMIADLIYGKGTEIWTTERSLSIQGEMGMIQVTGSDGKLVRADSTEALTIGSRRGLFAKDSHMVLNHIADGTPMYVTPEQSVYALQVADAARRSALTQTVVQLGSSLAESERVNCVD